MFSWRTGLFIATVVGLGWLLVYAGDVEMQVVHKNCWVEIFKDDTFDADDSHLRLQGPNEFATLNNLAGKDWSSDLEHTSVNVGSNATVRAYEDKDFKGTEIAFAPGHRVSNLGKLATVNDIESLRISCRSG